MPTSNPSVCAVMLANGRPEMVARAVKSFRAQTYERKRLLIWDTTPIVHGIGHTDLDAGIYHCDVPTQGESIGALRNKANGTVRDSQGGDLIVHWDSDDWSHPNRIAEQVALLQSSGAECVGYSEMMFWFNARSCQCFMSPGPPWYAAQCLKPLFHVGDHEFGTKEQASRRWHDKVPIPHIQSALQPGHPVDNSFGEAWLYRSSLPNYAIGTSMCYWRKTWERAPFPDYSEGCDDLYWFNGDKKSGVKPVKIESVSSVPRRLSQPERVEYARVVKQYYPDEVPANMKLPDESPRMIASIHGGNTCAAIKPGVEWTRVPSWDSYCRKEMAL